MPPTPPLLPLRPVDEDGAFIDLKGRNLPGGGTPLLTDGDHFFRTLDGGEMADVYTGQFVEGSVTPGVQGDLIITTASPNNDYGTDPYNTHTVPLDGSLITDVVPGVAFALDDDEAFGDNWAFEITLGLWLATLDQGNPLGDPPGSPAVERRLGGKNLLSTDLFGCYAYVRTPVKAAIAAGGGVFEQVLGLTNDPVEDTDPGTHVPRRRRVTFPRVTGSGSAKRGDMLVQRFFGDVAPVAVDVRDLEDPTGAVIPSSNGLGTAMHLDGRSYRIESNGMVGIRITPRTDVANSDAENLIVYTRRGAELAADNSGTAGEWGVADVPLTTQDGSTGAGIIRALTIAPYWYRVVIGEDFPPGGPYPFDVGFRFRNSFRIGLLG